MNENMKYAPIVEQLKSGARRLLSGLGGASGPRPETGWGFDALTGLYQRGSFLAHAERFLMENRGKALCMAAVDIDHFTLYNQFFGRKAGDRYLRFVAASLRNFVRKYGGVAGYFGADSFYYLCPDREEIFAAMLEKILAELRRRHLETGYAPKIGVCRRTDPALSALDLCDRAKSALSSIRNDFSHFIAWYGPSMERPGDEFRLILEVESGLRNHEFTFFLQPKCNMRSGKLVGAEALVRWVRKDGKIVRPDGFVPVLEENGLISRVDTSLWEDVCRFQRACIDKGYAVLPISVNISRTDFHDMDVTGVFRGLVERYALPADCLELEITESSCAGVDLPAEVARLKEQGFRILMDDFGSGYSSLNSLKDIDIDVLKMDMHFLEMDIPAASDPPDPPESEAERAQTTQALPHSASETPPESPARTRERSYRKVEPEAGNAGNAGKRSRMVLERGISILEGVVNMANAMRLPIVVEGVETAEQVKLLTSIHCLYAQGYYYYAPIRPDAYEALLADPGNLEPGGVHAWDAEPSLLMDLASLLRDDPRPAAGHRLTV